MIAALRSAQSTPNFTIPHCRCHHISWWSTRSAMPNFAVKLWHEQKQLVTRVTAPVINPPALVAATGRADIARRLAGMPGVITPTITKLSRTTILACESLRFPLLVRAPGFHTGRHFHFVEHRAALADAVAALTWQRFLAIQYFDARGPDGMARKYRVMFIDGVLYPLHLAISQDWKVHYFTAEMATNAACREEERRFLDDMPGVLGQRAMAALTGICAALGLDYAGVTLHWQTTDRSCCSKPMRRWWSFLPDRTRSGTIAVHAFDNVSLAVTRMLSRRLQDPID